MEYADIVVFAAVAAFLFVRLWANLGKRTEDERRRHNPFAESDANKENGGDVILLPDRNRQTAENPVITPFGHAAASLAGGLDGIREIDYDFDEKKFLQGAKAAFTAVVDAFAKGDLAHVERLLAPEVAHKFSKAVAERISSGNSLESKIEEIKDAEITAASVNDGYAKLTVNFVTNQTNVTRDGKGNVLSGVPGQLEEIHDTWVFGRDLSSGNPNWHILETR